LIGKLLTASLTFRPCGSTPGLKIEPCAGPVASTKPACRLRSGAASGIGTQRPSVV
jgi:hypothetical protein